MFGYVKIYKPELKVKDFYQYKAYYCGLCKTLKNRYGRFGQMTLSYDMTFLIILLTSLYESNAYREKYRCAIHPIKRHDTLVNEITEYVADMNIALTYHHFIDDWKDDKNLKALFYSEILKRHYKKICRKYPSQCSEIKKSLKRLAQCEKNKEKNIDTVSACFGQLMAGLFAFRHDVWEPGLRRMGFFLGKFIYIMDAYEDIEKDLKKSSFNPFVEIYQRDSFELDCRNMLIMMIAECTAEFEKLPCIADADILRNILYDGVWTKYDYLQNQKRREN